MQKYLRINFRVLVTQFGFFVEFLTKSNYSQFSLLNRLIISLIFWNVVYRIFSAMRGFGVLGFWGFGVVHTPYRLQESLVNT